MSLDGLTLNSIISELQSLIEARIEKIYQPAADELLFMLHTKYGRQRLVISASASDARIHITSHPGTNPDKAPNFCMLLRKYLGSGKIQYIRQDGLDRVVRMGISSKDELGILRTFELVTEIMGRYSNIILINEEGMVIDSIKHVSLDTSSKRQVLPGIRYSSPPTEKADPLDSDEEELGKLLAGARLPKDLYRILDGLSPQTSEELTYRIFGAESADIDENNCVMFAAALRKELLQMLSHREPCIQSDQDGKPVFYSIVPYHQYPEKTRSYLTSSNSMLDEFYYRRTALEEFRKEKSALDKILRKNTAKLEKRISIYMESMNGEDRIKDNLLMGELLSANLYRIKRGASYADVTDYYTGEEKRIPLDPAVSPSQNVNRFFRKAQKLKNAMKISREYYEKEKPELDYLYSLSYDLDRSEDMEDLSEIRNELIRYGYMETRKKEKQKNIDPLSRPLVFRTTDGMRIMAGRNSRQNDSLTMRVAEDEDVWFHVKSSQGSHVILFTGGNAPSERDIFEAAVIAATNSGSKNSSKVEIDYTERKNVWKANGAKPGMVLYRKYHTIIVDPDTALCDRLRYTEI